MTDDTPGVTWNDLDQMTPGPNTPINDDAEPDDADTTHNGKANQ